MPGSRRESCNGSGHVFRQRLMSTGSNSLSVNTSHAVLTVGSAPSSPAYKSRYRLVVLGGSRVGKTTLVHQLLYDIVPDKYSATVDEFYVVTCDDVSLEVVDTSGTDEFVAMRNLAISKANAVIFVFSVVEPASFDEIRRLRAMVRELRPEGLPTVVVANKCDLDTKHTMKREVFESVVTIDWEECYSECSALAGEGILESVSALVSQETSGQLLDHFRRKYKIRRLSVEEKRRQSLPVFGAAHRLKDLVTPKRNSCAMS